MTDAINRRTLQQALKAWHSASQLGQHDLAGLALVEARRIEAGYDASLTSYGVALREVLRAAIDALRPNGEADPLDKRWRAYLILNERYVQGRAPDFIADSIGIARSTYDHTQNAAVEALADLLRQQESSLDRPQAPRGPFLAPPRLLQTLVGREKPLKEVKNALTMDVQRVAMVGLPGVGKTTLAIHLASDSDVLAQFSDGVLWAGLGRNPHLAGLLGVWGIALGLSAEEISRLPSLDERARVLRALIGTKRLLIVLDDVWRGEDAAALLVGGANCAYLLTTRQPSLATGFAHTTFPIRELDADSGRALLGQFAPTLADDPAAASLVDAVGALPLALTLVGQYLRKEGHSGQARRLHSALAHLQSAEARLSLAQPASIDQQPSIEAGTPLSLLRVIELSIEALDEDSKAALYALSVFPPRPNTFSEAAALAVAACSPAALDTLVDAGLIEVCGGDRYSIHATIAEAARLQLADPHAALNRMAAHYADQPDLTDADQLNVLAALDAVDDPTLINAVCGFLESRGLYAEAEAALRRAEPSARDDPAVRVRILGKLGRVLQRRGDYPQADQTYQEALSLAYHLESDEFVSELYQGLGIVALSRGEYDRAESYLRDGLALARTFDDAERLSGILATLGALVFQRGDYAAAEAYLTESMEIAQAAHLTTRESVALTNLGVIAARRGMADSAEQHFQRALALAKSAGHRENSVFLLTNLGSLASDRGDADQAVGHYHEALTLARSIGQRARISQLLANLGMLATARGDYEQAQSYLDEGLALARSMQHAENTLLNLINMGALSIACGTYDQAAGYLDEALTTARVIGHRQYVCASLNAWGELHLQRGEIESARSAFGEALEIAEMAGMETLAKSAREGLKKAEKALNTK